MPFACLALPPPDRPPAAAVGGVPWGPLLYPEGAHGAPYFTQPGTQGPLLYPGGAHGAPPWGPFPGKKFSQLCCENFFPPSRSNSGPMGPPTLPSRGPRAPYFSQEGPMGPHLRLASLRRKNSRAQAREFFLSKSVFFLIFYFIIFILNIMLYIFC